MSEEEKNSIQYLKSRLYGNKGCKFIDVAQEDLRKIIKLIDVKEKGLKQANEIITEQDNQIIELNNKNCNLEFIIANQQKIIKEQSYTNKKLRRTLKTVRKERNKQHKEIEELKEYKHMYEDLCK